MKLKIIQREVDKLATEAPRFEEEVNQFMSSHDVVTATFQRNLFYPRRGMQFHDDLQETYTAFLVYEDKDEDKVKGTGTGMESRLRQGQQS